jgi:hypothetical protein
MEPRKEFAQKQNQKQTENSQLEGRKSANVIS